MAFSTLTHVARMLSTVPDAKWLVVGSTRVKVPLDDHAQIVQDGSDQPLKIHERAVLIAHGSVTVVRGTAVTYDGTAYTVRDVLPIENGDIVRVYLVPTTP